MKILIVDDDQNILRLYKEELEEEGYTIVTASNGQEAIERFDQEDPDLVTINKNFTLPAYECQAAFVFRLI